MFPGFFDELYENSGIVCNIGVVDEECLDFYNGLYTPREEMSRVLSKHNIDIAFENIMIMNYTSAKD
jgi:hypothetical protein